LGEWDKPTLYRDLTEYGNLVLLSDGEADPLVVKEALIAGLGVVVTPAAAANLDTSHPFITVIPFSRLRDSEFISNEIKKNRETALENREAIREYGIRNFHWAHLVETYTKLVMTLTESLSLKFYFDEQLFFMGYLGLKSPLKAWQRHAPLDTLCWNFGIR
jgi:glycosyltransferase involved in cell wall biosynthesis